MSSALDVLYKVRVEIVNRIDMLKKQAFQGGVGASEYKGMMYGRDGLYAILILVDSLITEEMKQTS